MSNSPSVSPLQRESAAWVPLLSGAVADRARAAVDAIAQELSLLPVYDAGLGAGAAGRALFFGYLEQAFPNHGHGAVAERFLDDAFTRLESAPSKPALYGGYVGVAWVAQHLRQFARFREDPDPEGEVEQALTEHLTSDSWNGNYDLIGGLVGIGVYALERRESAQARSCLQAVVQKLAASATFTSPGATWLTPPERLQGPIRESCPAGYFNLGVAHGVPGVIALLSVAEGCGVPEGLVAEAVEWLLRQRLAEDSDFPAWLPAGAPNAVLTPARLAWCYGDAGVAAALALAARASGSPTWLRAAHSIARAASQRAVEMTGVIDACLCHGSAGLAHVFARLARSLGDPSFDAVALGWYERTLMYRKGGVGVGGFCARGSVPRSAGEPTRADSSFLSGSLGIGLVLLSAIAPIAPNWDRVLLLSCSRAEQPRNAR
jgi:lantibiotic modifying enzyme